jgi:hypothetical protein
LRNEIRNRMWQCWVCCSFLQEKKAVKHLTCLMYSSSHRQASTPVLNIWPTLPTAPDLLKKFHSQQYEVATAI